MKITLNYPIAGRVIPVTVDDKADAATVKTAVDTAMKLESALSADDAVGGKGVACHVTHINLT